MKQVNEVMKSLNAEIRNLTPEQVEELNKIITK